MYAVRGAIGEDIFAQRVAASGAVMWGMDGVVITSDGGYQDRPVLASDGAGGAICAWNDQRSGDTNIYAQRVNANGVTQWTPNGVPIAVAPGTQELPRIVADDRGGAIVFFSDKQFFSPGKASAQHVRADGTLGN